MRKIPLSKIKAHITKFETDLTNHLYKAGEIDEKEKNARLKMINHYIKKKGYLAIWDLMEEFGYDNEDIHQYICNLIIDYKK